MADETIELINQAFSATAGVELTDAIGPGFIIASLFALLGAIVGIFMGGGRTKY